MRGKRQSKINRKYPRNWEIRLLECPKCAETRNPLYWEVNSFWVPFGIPGTWYSSWRMLCMLLHVCFMQWNYKPGKYRKEEGKFWGTTAAPIQSSSSLESKVGVFLPGDKVWGDWIPKCTRKFTLGIQILAGEEKDVVPELNWVTTRRNTK